MPRKTKKGDDARKPRVKQLPVPDSVSVEVGRVVTLTLGQQSALSLITLYAGDIDSMHFPNPDTRLTLCKRLDGDAEFLGAIRATLAAGFKIEWCDGTWTYISGNFVDRRIMLGVHTPTWILVPFLLGADTKVAPAEA